MNRMDVVTKGISAAVSLIERRLELPAPLSEDNFRYLAFHGLFKAGVDVTRVVLECPHPADSRAKVDTVILDAKGAPETAIEFKYHGSIPSNKNRPLTQSAGALIADFSRLRDFPNVRRFVAYLTDGEMFRYFDNPKNGLNWILAPSEQEISEGNLPNTKTLRERARNWDSPVRAQVTGSWDVGNHKLIVWRVWRP